MHLAKHPDFGPELADEKPEGEYMPDDAKEPSEKEDEQDGTLIELLIALTNRRDPVSPD